MNLEVSSLNPMTLLMASPGQEEVLAKNSQGLQGAGRAFTEIRRLKTGQSGQAANTGLSALGNFTGMVSSHDQEKACPALQIWVS